MKREHVENSQHEGASYCLYSPPSSEPVHGLIMFLHGGRPWESGANDPMLQFLAQAGFYVVYPHIPNLFRDLPYYPTRARAALSNALSKLKTERNVDIKRVAVVGHSIGGAAAVRVATTWTGLATIQALVLLDPADAKIACDLAPADRRCKDEWDYNAQPHTKIACSTRLLIIQAETELAPGFGATAVQHWRDLRHIAKYAGASGATPQRNFLRVRNDVSHPGIAILESTHFTPVVLDPLTCLLFSGRGDYGCHLTSMDEYGYWRPTRAAVYEAFHGRPFAPNYSPYCSSASTAGSCATTRDMGKWLLDGLAATPIKNAADLTELNLLANIPDYCPR
jgi:pimeloyl-ACP methyl ester carboxylesterase